MVTVTVAPIKGIRIEQMSRIPKAYNAIITNRLKQRLISIIMMPSVFAKSFKKESTEAHAEDA